MNCLVLEHGVSHHHTVRHAQGQRRLPLSVIGAGRPNLPMVPPLGAAWQPTLALKTPTHGAAGSPLGAAQAGAGAACRKRLSPEATSVAA